MSRTEPKSVTKWGAVNRIATLEHDGHLLIVQEQGGILHHPDCPCLAKTTAKKATRK